MYAYILIANFLLFYGCKAKSPNDAPSDNAAVPNSEIIDDDTSPDSSSIACPPTEATVPEEMTIASLTDFINQLPKPLSASCLLTYLPKPLLVHTTASKASVQRAVSKDNPRVFFRIGKIHFSIALTNSGSQRLEIAEIVDDLSSIKAEIGVPIEDTLSQTAMYSRALQDATATTCSRCHIAESPAGEGYPSEAFVSQSIRPNPDKFVSLDHLKNLGNSCDESALGGKIRCDVLAVIAKDGWAEEFSFSENMPIGDF